MIRKDTKPGTRVRIHDGCGLDSGKTATVIDRRTIPTCGRGVPRVGKGHYNPMEASDIALRMDDGSLDVWSQYLLSKEVTP